MYLTIYIGNLILGIIFFAFVLKKGLNFISAIKIFLISLIFNFFLRGLLTLLNFFTWFYNPIGRIILNDFNYFLYYSATRFWFDFLASLLLGFFFGGLFFIINLIFKKRLLSNEEFIIFPVNFIIAGWPFNFFLPVLVLLIVFFVFFGKILLGKEKKERISAKNYYFLSSVLLNLLNIIFLPKLNFWRFG